MLSQQLASVRPEPFRDRVSRGVELVQPCSLLFAGQLLAVGRDLQLKVQHRFSAFQVFDALVPDDIWSLFREDFRSSLCIAELDLLVIAVVRLLDFASLVVLPAPAG